MLVKGPRRAKRSFEVMGDFYHGDDVYHADQNNAKCHENYCISFSFLVFTTLSLLFCTGLFDTECIFVFLFVIPRLALYRFVLQIPKSDEWISAQMAFPCLLH